MKYEKLFQKGKIGKMELKNRIVMPPMGTGLNSASGEVTEHIIKYYEERAKGGCGLIITEISRVDDEWGIGMPNQIQVTHSKFIAGIERLAKAVHKHDSKLLIQLQHAGRENRSSLIDGRQIVAPSAIPCKVVGEMPRALTTAECEMLVGKFVKGAVIAKMANADGVELHAAHGYLINQFLSPYTNKREDKYGGNFEKRMRFIQEIIDGIRLKCGRDFIISVRISADEFVEGGLRIEDSVEIARRLEYMGINCINVSTGIYESSYTIVEDYVFEQGWKRQYAAAIKKAVKMPVIACCNIKRPEVAEELLETGVCDYVALGRQQLAEPEWGNKSKAGREDDIRPCIGCLYCFKEIGMMRTIKCTVNPRLGREVEFARFEKDGDGRKVVVVGGGPGGMEAARVLAIRGFDVTLLEKSDALGGTLNVADKPPHKKYLTWLVNNLSHQIKELGVDIKLNCAATVDEIKKYDPYAVIVAAGGTPTVPRIPGIDGANVVLAEDLIVKKHVDLKGKNVAIIGGGVTGLEVAEMFGGECNATVYEMARAVGTSLYPVIARRLLMRLGQNGTKIETGTSVVSIGDGEITVATRAGARKEKADVVVLAVGVTPQRQLADEIEAAFDNVKVVGDAKKAGLISDAIREGFEKAFVL
ncbi:MAG: FAD-dependent oxidoreductase [Clostridia bacterium]|nr:FAD-dependent oxidoreductase [Clostridia bacterium]